MTREEYSKCFSNGKKLIDKSVVFSKNDEFGLAVSFLVLGMEELIKYLVVQAAAFDETIFTQQELQKNFSSHEQKHKLIIEFLESTKLEFGEDFVQSIFNEHFKETLSSELKKVQKNRFKEFGTMVGLTEQHLTSEEIDEFICWIKKEANSYKNKGLYVGRDNHNSLFDTQLNSPDEVDKSVYSKVLKFANSFLSQAEFSKSIDLEESEIIEILNSIK